MSQATKIQEIVDLFAAAGSAHHQAYSETDGTDDEWPIWYAGYLQEKLSLLLEAKLTQSEIVYLIIGLDREQRTVAPGASWPRYYAKALVERYL